MKIANRIHRIISERREQIARNIAAWKGGRPYIRERLWRAPNESDLSWFGTSTVGISENARGYFPSSGRVHRTAMVNDAGRVVSKITQYLFKTPATRADIDEDWAADVTGTGVSVENFWIDVSESLTVGQWVWVQADRLAPIKDAQTGTTRQRTLLEKQRDGDMVRWTIWPSLSVPDWAFGDDGKLLWLITEGEIYDNSDPEVDAKTYKLRTLWRQVANGYEVTQYKTDIGTSETNQLTDPVFVQGEIPFVLIGWPSLDPWWFDDVECIQAQLLNLDSLHHESLVKTVFPQLVIPTGMLENLQTNLIERVGAANGERLIEVVKEIVRGLDAPIVESADEKGVTRFIQPSNSDQETIPNEMRRKRQLLFDMVGLSLFNKETRLVQTAESKQFDQLDTESTLKHRALVLQIAEEKLVAASKEVDPSFSEYIPVWPTSFDVVDVEADSSAIAMLGNLPDLTLSMRKIVLSAALRILSERGGYDEELIAQAREEIAALTDAPAFDPSELFGDLNE